MLKVGDLVKFNTGTVSMIGSIISIDKANSSYIIQEAKTKHEYLISFQNVDIPKISDFSFELINNNIILLIEKDIYKNDLYLEVINNNLDINYMKDELLKIIKNMGTTCEDNRTATIILTELYNNIDFYKL